MKEIRLKWPMILISLSFGMMSFFLPIYSKEMGMNATEIGGMFSVVSFMLLVLRPRIGKVSDKVGRKPLLVISMLLYSISFYLLASASTVSRLYTIRILQGIASAIMGITTYAMIIDSAEQKRVSEVFGEMTSVSTIGMMIGSGLSFIVLLNRPFLQGWYQLFLLFAVAALSAGILVAVQTPETRRVAVKVEALQKVRKTLGRDVMVLMGVGFLISLATSMMSPILLVYLQDYFTNNLVGLAFAFLPSMIIYSILPARLGRVGDRYGKVKVIIIGLMISGLAAACIPIVNSLVWLMCLWTIDAIGDLLEGPARTALFSQLVGKEKSGENFGVYSAIRSIGAIIGPVLGGMLYDKISPKVPFYLCSLGLMSAAILVGGFLYRKYQHIEATGERCIE